MGVTGSSPSRALGTGRRARGSAQMPRLLFRLQGRPQVTHRAESSSTGLPSLRLEGPTACAPRPLPVWSESLWMPIWLSWVHTSALPTPLSRRTGGEASGNSVVTARLRSTLPWLPSLPVCLRGLRGLGGPGTKQRNSV